MAYDMTEHSILMIDSLIVITYIHSFCNIFTFILFLTRGQYVFNLIDSF